MIKKTCKLQGAISLRNKTNNSTVSEVSSFVSTPVYIFYLLLLIKIDNKHNFVNNDLYQ